jgi:hypothetical protein
MFTTDEDKKIEFILGLPPDNSARLHRSRLQSPGIITRLAIVAAATAIALIHMASNSNYLNFISSSYFLLDKEYYYRFLYRPHQYRRAYLALHHTDNTFRMLCYHRFNAAQLILLECIWSARRLVPRENTRLEQMPAPPRHTRKTAHFSKISPRRYQMPGRLVGYGSGEYIYHSLIAGIIFSYIATALPSMLISSIHFTTPQLPTRLNT